MIVTDHHRPGDELPDCPIVATRPSDYPFPDLCGTGVVYKLGQALLGPDSDVLRRHLDLVALATIADVVPLVGENRSLAIAGLRTLARTQKLGLRALMKPPHVDPAAVDAGKVGFRLAPRINAAGRLGHPRAALELLLTEDADEARRLADRLEELNRDRQAVEDEIVRAAIAQVEEWPEAKRRRPAYVVWGEDWHEGVIGIVASRLVERYHRPVVLIAGGEGLWKGSGRSIPSFDLHGALGACSQFLERFGGHRAAAGSLDRCPGRSNRSPRRSRRRRRALLAPDDLLPTTVVDAVLPRGAKLTLDLCEELRQLAPFGLGQPRRHAARAGLRARGARDRRRRESICASACNATDATRAARSPSARERKLDRYRRAGRYDVAFRLQENHWNGTVVAAARRASCLRRRRPLRRGVHLAASAVGRRSARRASAGDLRRARGGGREGQASSARVGDVPRAAEEPALLRAA